MQLQKPPAQETGHALGADLTPRSGLKVISHHQQREPAGDSKDCRMVTTMCGRKEKKELGRRQKGR